jgi:ABC-type glycerol-3-phosphate transport system substrate-binding protein
MKRGLQAVFLIACTVLLAVSLVSCKVKPKEVTLTSYAVPNDWKEGGQELYNAFMKKFPNIKIEDIPYTTDSLTFLRTRGAVNDLPDIHEINNDEAGLLFAKEGKLMDLKALPAAKHVYPTLLKEFTISSGLVFGFPQGSSTAFIYYNKELFNELGLEAPTDFDELIAVCEKIKAKGITPIGLAGQDPWNTEFPFDWIFANQVAVTLGPGEYQKKLQDGSFSLDNPESIEVFRKIKKLSSFFQKGVTNDSETSTQDLFAKKKVAMTLAGSWNAALAERAGFAGAIFPPFGKKGAEQWVVNSPESAIGASNTHTAPEYVDAKTKFLDFWFSPEGYQYMQNARGNIPSIDNAVNVKIMPDIQALLPILGKNPSIPFLMNTYSTAASDVFIASLSGVFIGSTSPETAAKRISEAIKANPKIR